MRLVVPAIVIQNLSESGVAYPRKEPRPEQKNSYESIKTNLMPNRPEFRIKESVGNQTDRIFSGSVSVFLQTHNLSIAPRYHQGQTLRQSAENFVACLPCPVCRKHQSIIYGSENPATPTLRERFVRRSLRRNFTNDDRLFPKWSVIWRKYQFQVSIFVNIPSETVPEFAGIMNRKVLAVKSFPDLTTELNFSRFSSQVNLDGR